VTREVGDSADKRAQVVSRERRREGRGGSGCLPELGRPRKRKGRRGRKGRWASGPVGERWASRPNERKRGRDKELAFLFSKQFSNFIFK